MLAKIKQRIFLLIKNIEIEKYYKKDVFKEKELADKNIVDFVTIAFNNAEVIKYQHKLLSKFCQDKFNYMVADNSTDKLVAQEIKAYCDDVGIKYRRLPNNPYPHAYASFSHAASLNYIYYNYIKKRNANIFAILDHDIFPIKPFSAQKYTSELGGFYGFIGNDKPISDRWLKFRGVKASKIGADFPYIWPGVFFAQSKMTNGHKIDFRPNFGGDSGSGNFYSLYYDFFFEQNNSIDKFPQSRVISLWESDNKQDSSYQMILSVTDG